MATSLARQLKKLQAPQTSLLNLDKKKPSLLFDPSEAASLDRSAVYDIGTFPYSFVTFRWAMLLKSCCFMNQVSLGW